MGCVTSGMVQVSPDSKSKAESVPLKTDKVSRDLAKEQRRSALAKHRSNTCEKAKSLSDKVLAEKETLSTGSTIRSSWSRSTAPTQIESICSTNDRVDTKTEQTITNTNRSVHFNQPENRSDSGHFSDIPGLTDDNDTENIPKLATTDMSSNNHNFDLRTSSPTCTDKTEEGGQTGENGIEKLPNFINTDIDSNNQNVVSRTSTPTAKAEEDGNIDESETDNLPNITTTDIGSNNQSFVSRTPSSPRVETEPDDKTYVVERGHDILNHSETTKIDIQPVDGNNTISQESGDFHATDETDISGELADAEKDVHVVPDLEQNITSESGFNTETNHNDQSENNAK